MAISFDHVFRFIEETCEILTVKFSKVLNLRNAIWNSQTILGAEVTAW